MNQRRRLESVATLLSPEEVPTRHFFAIDRHQAESGFGGVTALEILESVEEVDRTIRVFDELRATQHLDLIDTAIVIQQQAFPHYAQTASSVAGSIVQAFFHWDQERFGEAVAWRQQRSRGQFESMIAGRLVGMTAS
jgi:hypothetical protein